MIGIGTRLAHYELTGHLGSGGMGDVYEARDLRLGRSVAVKVLPEAFAADPDRIARFEREAKVLASLNHPNIASIYGLEEAGGRHLLVMELVGGDTLAAQITRGPIAVERALDLAQQIAEALESAHEKGIVHRDLKPANVKVTPDGKVKVLDFGLAKAMEMSPAAASISNSPTLTALATSAGVILGTAAYMSPEQARGENADQRSDTFSFGCVLYEMLSGRQAFQGKTATDILASVLAREPDFTSLPPRLHPKLVQLLHRALEKEARRRWQAIGDLRLEIEAIRSGGAFVETATLPSRPLWKRALPLAGAAIVASLVTGAAMWTLRSAAPTMLARFFIPLPETPGGFGVAAISPDGSQIVYAGKDRLYLRPIDELNGRPIPGTEHRGFGASPDFSPDGKWIVFVDAVSFTDAIVKRIAPTGGTPVPLYEGAYPSGLNWGEGGIVFWSGKGLQRIPISGGEPELLLSTKGTQDFGRPELLPGGKVVLFAAGSGLGSELRIVVQPLKSGERKTIIERGGDVRYLPTGHLVYMRSGTLTAMAFDAERLEVSGEPVPIVEGIQTAALSGSPQFDFSDTGSLIFLPGPTLSRGWVASLGIIDRKGVVTALPVPNDAYVFPRLSPDGKRIVFGTDSVLFAPGAGKDANVYVYDLAGTSAPRRLALEKGNNRYPIWLGNEFVAFQSDREGDLGIFRQRADGGGAAERLTKPAKDEAHIPDSWSSVGETFSYTAVKGSLAAVWTYSLRDNTATLFAEDPSSFVGRSVFSPDGRWLAYHQIRPEMMSVFIQAFPTGTKFLISKGLAHSPAWSRDGRELFYIRDPALLASVRITTTPGFSSGNPVPEAMPVGDISPGAPRMYDVTPDGRFLTVFPVSTDDKDTPPGIRVVLNWFDDVKRRVGGN